MKKILAFTMVVMMILGLSVMVSASNDLGEFVQSPSLRKAPLLISYESEDEECRAEVEIYSYIDRNKLSYSEIKELEDAYYSIASTDDISKLTPDVGELANELQIDSSHLLVSELFDINYKYCWNHDDHGNLTITIRPSYFEKMVGLLHYTDGEWELVDYELNLATGDVIFTVSDLSPFAIVVHDGILDEPVASDDADGSSNTLLIVAIAVAVGAVALGTGVVIYKKKKG